jgi:hypothetical protein
VAALVQVDGAALVLDPALDPEGPMALEAWLRVQTTDLGSIRVAICREHGGDRNGVCDTPEPQTDHPSETGAPHLEFEWTLAEALGRDPVRSLGDCPPWRHCEEPPIDATAPRIRRFANSNGDPDVIPGDVATYLLGDNFLPGVTRVRLRNAAGLDRFLSTGEILRRRVTLAEALDSGEYDVTVSNADDESAPFKLIVN